jgi:hypothetical protein
MKIKTLDSKDAEKLKLFANKLGKRYDKALLDYYLILIKQYALEANEK